MSDFTIDDMINSALESKPDTFKDAFNSLMLSKITQAVEDRKQEIASTMFADENDNDQDEEDLEQDEIEVENAEDTETDA